MYKDDDDTHIKLIDFGLAKKVSKNELMNTPNGTPYYIAPEVLQQKYNEKCDDEELRQSLNRLVLEKINPEQVKPYKNTKKEKTPKKGKIENINIAVEKVIEQIVENTNPDSPILS